MANKRYSAFVSSAFKEMRDQRNTVIDALLDHQMLPLGMEHFTVSAGNDFSDIERLIDDADLFIMLLGDSYGSCDSRGISWTEREFRYAQKIHKPILAIACTSLIALRAAPSDQLTEDQRKQLAFSQSLTFGLRDESAEFGIKKILTQFLAGFDFDQCAGWVRGESAAFSQAALDEWRRANASFDLSGQWFHIHLTDTDEDYIRVGNLTIDQDFTPNKYCDLRFNGLNYGVLYYDTSTKVLKENQLKRSKFIGEYKLHPDSGQIFGIFNATRNFKGTFNSIAVTQGSHRGIHDFQIEPGDGATMFIAGEFHDEAPSPKEGLLFLFRDIDQRNAFLLEHRGHIIQQK